MSLSHSFNNQKYLILSTKNRCVSHTYAIYIYFSEHLERLITWYCVTYFMNINSRSYSNIKKLTSYQAEHMMFIVMYGK